MSSFFILSPIFLICPRCDGGSPVEYYDYIIVGGGTSGCALAATLSEGAKVLLLERGDLPYGQPTINNIATFAATLADNSPSSPSSPSSPPTASSTPALGSWAAAPA